MVPAAGLLARLMERMIVPVAAHLVVPFTVTVEPDGSGLEDVAFKVLDALIGLEGVSDETIDVNLGTGVVTFEVLAQGSTPGEAIDRGLAAIRTAIHLTGHHTHGWDEPFSAPTSLTTRASRWEAGTLGMTAEPVNA